MKALRERRHPPARILSASRSVSKVRIRIRIHLMIATDGPPYSVVSDLQTIFTICLPYVIGQTWKQERKCEWELLHGINGNGMQCKSHVARSCYSIQATNHSYGASKNSTLRNFVLPGPIITKLGTLD